MVILIVFIKAALIEKQDVAIIDWAMFTSIVVALLLNSFSKMFRTLLLNKLEDSVKLTCDYEKLMKKYECEIVRPYCVKWLLIKMKLHLVSM